MWFEIRHNTICDMINITVVCLDNWPDIEMYLNVTDLIDIIHRTPINRLKQGAHSNALLCLTCQIYNVFIFTSLINNLTDS